MTSRILSRRLLQSIQQNIKPYFVLYALHASLFSGCYGAGTTNFVKSMSTTDSIIMGNNLPTINIAYYEEIKDLPNHPEKLLIDVRAPQEILDTGKIPTSINIPLAEVQQVLSRDGLKPEDFKEKYGRDKPAINMEIIFTCRSGRRAQIAAETAVSLGYTNVKNYQGSWIDWADHEGLPK